MYAFYFGTIDAMEKLLSARDATRIAKRPILIDKPHNKSYETNISAGRRVWEGFDTATDIADEFGLLSKRASRYLSVEKMAINVIDKLGNGQYIGAMGDVILSVADFNNRK